MRLLLAACGGFLLAVLWFDLMFDVQALGVAPGDLPEPVLASTATYYRRVTTEAAPMNRLVGAAMIVGLAASIYQLIRGRGALWRRWASLALLVAPVMLAAIRVFPNAARLGSRVDSIAVQSDLARRVLHDHIFCVVAIASFLLLQVLPSRESV